MKEDSFIGTTITTKYGNILTVESVSHVQKNNVKVYNVSCNICAKDLELYPDLFTTTKGNIVSQNKCPCGCSSSHKKNQRSWEVVAKRYCKEYDLEYQGFEGTFKNSNTLFKYQCKVCGLSHKIPLFKISIYKGCKDCIIKTNTTKLVKSDESNIKNFKDNKLLPDYYSYERLNRTEWNIHCEVCSKDIFSFEGLCDGTFKTTSSNLLKGIKPCRCSPAWRLKNIHFVKLIAKNKLPGCDLRFGDFKGIYTLISWTCPYGHKNTRSLYEILYKRKTACGTCNSFNWKGLYSQRLEENDTLYFISLTKGDESFLKVGRSFDVKKRFRDYKYLGYSVRILDLKHNKHEKVWLSEQEFLIRNRGLRYTPIDVFAGSGECFLKTAIDKLKEDFSYVEFYW